MECDIIISEGILRYDMPQVFYKNETCIKFFA